MLRINGQIKEASDDEAYEEDNLLSIQIDKFNDLIKGKGHWHEKMLKMKELLGNLNGKAVLDLGTQVGTYSLILSEESEISVGIDFARLPLKKAIHIGRLMKCSNAWFIQANVNSLPIGDECFDVVVASDIVEHLVDYDLIRMLKEAYRVMKRKGILLLQTYPNKYSYCFFKFNKFSIIPIIMFWLPRRIYSEFIDIYHRGVMLARRTKWRITRNIPKGMHINCQTLESITEVVQSCGFKIDMAFAENTYSEYERTVFFKSMEKLTRNNSVTKQNIYLKATKE